MLHLGLCTSELCALGPVKFPGARVLGEASAGRSQPVIDSGQSHCHGKVHDWGDQWHKPLNRDSDRREQQPEISEPRKCKSHRHRE